MPIDMDQTEASELVEQNAVVTIVSAKRPIKVEQEIDTTVAETPGAELPSDNSTIDERTNEHERGDEVDDHQQQQYTSDCKTLKESVYDAVVGANDQELAKRQYVDDDIDDIDDCDDTFDKKDVCLPKSKRHATSSSVTTTPYKDSDEKQDENNQDSLGHNRNNHQSNGSHADHLDMNHSKNGTSECSTLTQNDSDSNHYDARSYRHSDEPEQMRKLFIGGLDYKTSEETLKKHFEKFGDVIDCVVMREQVSKRSRGFGFVIYASSLMVDRAQKARPHEVDGREVQSKRAISREDSGKPEAQATVKKVYLGGLSDDIDESELRDYFKEFGNIININIVAHKDTGKRRGFAFVEYDDHDPVDKIVSKKFHTIKDKRVEAKKAIPKVEMDARKRVDPRASMAGSMMALSGGVGGGLSPSALDGPARGSRSGARGSSAAGPNFLWDSPYGPGIHHGYSTAALDAYPPHYHSTSAHYEANWMMQGGSGGSQGSANPYGFRSSHNGSAYGRSGYSGHAAAVAAAAAAAAAAGAWQDYGGFSSPVAAQNGGPGPMRHLASYQHSRSYRPYASGGSSGYGSPISRGNRGYNP